MNRLASLLGGEVAEATSLHEQDEMTFCSSSRSVTDHASFAPLHYEKNYAYPLFIWLHGADDNELQLHKVMPHISLRNYVALGPRGTRSTSEGQWPAAYAWVQSAADIQLAEERLLACLRTARERFHIAEHRIFLAGYDCGGTMALRLAFRQPDLFAGVASINGAFPFGHQPLIQFDAARRVPVLLAHGRDSELYNEDRICDDLRLLHAAGVPTTLRQYPCGDELTTQMLCDLDHWMMERITGMASHVEPTWRGIPGWNHRN